MSSSLPWSEKTEQSLLGAVLIKPEILHWLEVSNGCFHSAQNRAVWAAMISIHARGRTVDEVSLEAELAAEGTLEAIGGVAYLGRISLTCITSANAGTYAATLERYRITRDVLRISAEVQADDDLFGEELLDSMLGGLGGIQRTKANELTSIEDTTPEMIRRLIDDVDAAGKGAAGSSFVQTGIGALDEAVGGTPMGTVTLIGGRPAGGKSSALLAFGESAASLGKVAAIFTTEDPRDRWTERLLAKHSKVAVDRIYMRTLNPAELAAITTASDIVSKMANLHIVHAHGMTAQEMTRIASVLGAQFIGIDYIQKVKAPEPKMQLHEAIEANSKHFGDYAGKSGAAVVILSQLSKDVEKEDRRPRISDLRYGDGLAQECKLGLLLHNPKSTNAPMLREILIAKRNQGETDQAIRVKFDGAHCTFLEHEERPRMGPGNDF